MKQGFVIHHNGPNTNLAGKPHSACEAYWNGVRRFHMEVKGWSDIAYSFGQCHHGVRFVGRGWNRNQFANGSDVVGVDDGKDSEWYTVLVFLGWNDNASRPIDEEPSPQMIAGVKALIAEGRDSGRCGTRVLPHNAFKPKRCPGATFTALAAMWNRAPLTPPTPAPPEPPDHQETLVSYYYVAETQKAYCVRAHVDPAKSPPVVSLTPDEHYALAAGGAHFVTLPTNALWNKIAR